MIYSEDTPTFHHSNKNEKRGDQALKNINDFWLNFDFDGARITFDILLVFFFFFCKSKFIILFINSEIILNFKFCLLFYEYNIIKIK